MESQKVHSSWLIAWVSAGSVVGLALCWFVPSRLSILVVVVGLAMVIGAFMWRAKFAIILVILGGLLCGVWRGSLERGAIEEYAPLIGKKVQVSGIISEDVETGTSGDIRLKVGSVKMRGRDFVGQVWVSASTHLAVKRSDSVVVEGKLRAGFGTFPASMSFARIVKVSRVAGSDPGREVRDYFVDAIRRCLAEPGASLASGFLTGQKAALPSELSDQLKIVGLTHIVVASGSNLTILVRFSRRLFSKLSKFSSTMLASGLIVGFLFVTGLSPSMSRAGMVSGLSLCSWYYGRSVHPFVLLSFVAAITTLINPLFLWGDLGWYLSFAAFVGVIIVSPLAHHALWGTKKPGVIRQLFVDTICAQVVTMPIIAFSFGTYALYALPANALVVPLIPLAMLLTFVAGMIAVVVPWLSPLVGWPAQLVVNYMLWVVQWLADAPGAQGEVTFDISLLVASYVVIICIGIIAWRRTRHSFWNDNLVE